MPNALTISQLAEGFTTALITQQVAGVLDLAGLAVGIWTVWSSISLPFGGKLQRAFQLIGFGALAFAISHLIDSIVTGLRLLSDEQAMLLMQGMVLISMLFFVPGLAGLADLRATHSARRTARFPRFWPMVVILVIVSSALSFTLYGISPQAETAALIGLDTSIAITTVLCIALLLRARVGGVIGRSLWLAMLGLLLFSLDHPFQMWLGDKTGFPDDILAIVHRLIVIPALLLFALSIGRLARRLSISLSIEAAHTSILPNVKEDDPEAVELWKTIFSPRARARRNSAWLRVVSNPDASRPFPASRQRSANSTS